MSKLTAHLLLFVTLLWVGCETVPNSARHPEFQQRYAEMEHVAYLAPHIEVFQLTAGGESIKHDEWTEQGAQNMLNAVANKRSLGDIALIEGSIPEDVQDELEEIHLLYQSIRVSVARHVFVRPVDQFPGRLERFEYSVGSIDRILDYTGGDALLLIEGISLYSTGGRRAMMALGMLAGGVTGVAVIPAPGGTYLSAALIDRNGDILWMKVPQAAADMRDPERAKAALASLLEEFPDL